MGVVDCDLPECPLAVIGVSVCDDVNRLCDEIDGWTIWDENETGYTVHQKTKPDGSSMGRASITWDSSTSIEIVSDFLWNTETKPLYDKYTKATLLIKKYSEDFHIIDQVFSGRFGLSGRDFVILVHKQCYHDADQERFVIGVKSIDLEFLENLVQEMDDEVKLKYLEMTSACVRGDVILAGFQVTKKRNKHQIKISYINDVHVAAKGVPGWIVKRVKLDQLKIIKEIPQCCDKYKPTTT